MKKLWDLSQELHNLLHSFQCAFAHYNITFYVGKSSVWISSKQMEDNAFYNKYLKTHCSDDENWEIITQKWWYGEYKTNKTSDSILIKISKEHFLFMQENCNWDYIFEPYEGSSLSEVEWKEYGYRGKRPEKFHDLHK
jgi:hypothetical protein